MSATRTERRKDRVVFKIRLRRLRGLSIAFTAVFLGASAVTATLAAPPAVDPPIDPPIGAVERVALAAGLPHDDLSPVLGLDSPLPASSWVRQRPVAYVFHQIANDEPAVRVHFPPRVGPDNDLDGVPDRAALALATAVHTLEFCQRAGLGQLADDGDGELDVYLLPPDGAVRGYAAIEHAAPPGRGASGFVVADLSYRHDDQTFVGSIARSAARLVLAGKDAGAPSWWVEPSALWIETHVVGPSLESERLLQARWNHPERGPLVDDAVLARGNVGLLWSLGNEAHEARTLAASWRDLAARSEAASPREVIDAARRRSTGLGLAELQIRAALTQLTGDVAPGRFTADVEVLPVFDQPGAVPVAPLGLGLVRVRPDPSDGDGTRLRIRVEDDEWTAHLLARRRAAGWDHVPLGRPLDGEFSVTLPWTDYDEASIVLARDQNATFQAGLLVQATSLGHRGPFALSSLGGRPLPGSLVEISWVSAWEMELFGWLVERAGSPDGPWQIIAPSPIPALGLPREGTGYAVLDQLLVERSPLYYRVVALTSDGLRISSPHVTVALPTPDAR
ncbi:MAG: hypothetical protein JSV80_05225 [Acidobacteriota bacterium]|nr:MAG: hypothetical protein JSV80_05225 [Acidobacteriota bacterium]